MPLSELEHIWVTVCALQRLLQNSGNCLLYVNLLRQLAIQQSAKFYMSDTDWDLAVGLIHPYQPGNDRICSEAYTLMQELISIKRVQDVDREYAREFLTISPANALQLACASHHDVDAIMTLRSGDFVRHPYEAQSLRENQYFDIRLGSTMTDGENEGNEAFQTIRVFSVNRLRRFSSASGVSLRS
jgi:hypothetical protein